jgi:hypothetical protein
MTKILFLFVIFTSIYAYATEQSPYITVCDAPACSKTASRIDPPQHKTQDGLVVITDPGVMFNAPGSVTKLAAQGDILAIFFERGQKMGATTLTFSAKTGTDLFFQVWRRILGPWTCRSKKKMPADIEKEHGQAMNDSWTKGFGNGIE